MISAREFLVLVSACVSRAGDGVCAAANFFRRVDTRERILVHAKFVAVEHRDQHAGRMRYTILKSLRT